MQAASVGGEEYHVDGFQPYDWARETERIMNTGMFVFLSDIESKLNFIDMALTGPSEFLRQPARSSTQMHIRLQTRFRQAAGLPSLPEGTLMDSTGLYPVIPLTRSSSQDSSVIGTLKRPAPTQEAATRPTSPKRPKT